MKEKTCIDCGHAFSAQLYKCGYALSARKRCDFCFDVWWQQEKTRHNQAKNKKHNNGCDEDFMKEISS